VYVLNDLWRGNISPCERYVCSDSKYQEVFQQFCKESDLFAKDLSPEKQKRFEEIQELQLKLIDISETDTFIVGFRLGARMILDVVGEYRGQFKTPTDS